MAGDAVEANFRVIGEGGPAELLRQDLLNGLQDDLLYRRLQDVGWSNQVITQDLLAGLTSGMFYGTPDLARLIGASDVPESTIRTWVDRFMDYVQPTRDGRNYKFSVAAVVRVRILFLLIKQLRWNFAGIRNVLSGLVEEADLLEQAGQGDTRDVLAALDKLPAVRGADLRSVDPRVLNLFLQLVDLQASTESGRLVVSRDALPADVRDSVERVAQLEEENQRLRQELASAANELTAVKDDADTLNERLQLAEGQIDAQAKAWASVPPEAVKALLERQNRGFWARLFGK